MSTQLGAASQAIGVRGQVQHGGEPVNGMPLFGAIRDAGRNVGNPQMHAGHADLLDAEAGKVGGFSLHTGVAANAYGGQKLERLCGYQSTSGPGSVPASQ